ncbi:N-methyl-L-tryptophan oxidase [Nonomuraea turcica]|uniref:N-methyl-L-tryptophan oxidase n=1 Tax=Nonomuraea sp. G32 TaxID=3067274 RepID=UPI00273A859C|nr:N-methyl-L-tryptophan oxidase [Nonomuraea sp. G32]MDP4511685.1 N-methyl-L-tryptophan oxidase [Nonomuraea sp. G32]
MRLVETARRRAAVIGAGAVGSMAAWQLAERGLEVHAFDRWGVPHHRGASGGQSRRFAVISMADPDLPPLVLRAEQLWRQLEDATGRRLLEQTGGLILGPASSTSVRQAVTSCENWGLAHRILDAHDLRQRFPQHTVDDEDIAVQDPATGFLRPELAILAAVEQVAALGATVHHDTEILDIDLRSETVRLTYRSSADRPHSETFDAVVLAPGAWAATLLPDGLREAIGVAGLTARRLAQTWFVPDDPSLYGTERFPVFERVAMPDGASIYGFPSLDGATVKIGVKSRPHPEVADPARPNPYLTADHMAEVRDVVARWLPQLNPRPVQTSVHVESYTEDGRPVVGLLPGAAHLAVAVGFSGGGFKYAPAVGEALADLLVDGVTEASIRQFAPGRSATV